MATGIQTILIWDAAKKSDDFRGREDYATTYSAGVSLGALCIVLSLTYLLDFIFSYRKRKAILNARYNQEPYRNGY